MIMITELPHKKVTQMGNQADHCYCCNVKLLDSQEASLYISKKEYGDCGHERLY
jgi:hypothetical protein